VASTQAGASEQQQGEHNDCESEVDYAHAAMAGLPQDDDAVVLARLAAASGKSLQDLVEFSYLYGGLHNKGRCAIPGFKLKMTTCQ
jgi:hypothetical protein